MISSFKQVVDICGQASSLARALGLRVSAVQKWKDRDNIPPEYWPQVIRIAKKRGRTLTPDRLMRLSARRLKNGNLPGDGVLSR